MMTRRPDQDTDVIVHQIHERDSRDIWMIRLGGEKQGERMTLASALELARRVALTNGRPAWLLDETGYPWKPIEPSIWAGFA